MDKNNEKIFICLKEIFPSPISSLSQCFINPKLHWCSSKASPATLKRGARGGGMEILCDFSQNILSEVVGL